MRYLPYTLAWAMMFASGTSCMMLYSGKLERDKLPAWLRGDFGRRYAYPLLFVVWFSAIALLVFGLWRLTWYWTPVCIAAGLITSAVVQGWVPKRVFVVAGPPILIALQAGLWLNGGHTSPETGRDAAACRVCGAANWSRVSPKGGGFTVMMPAPIRESTVLKDTKVGHVVRSYFTARPMPGVSFELCHNRFPTNADMKDPTKALDAAAKGGLRRDGRLLSNTKITLRGYPGRDGIQEQGGKVIVGFRLFLVGHDFFELACEMPKSQLCNKHMSQFLDSFDLETALEPGGSAEPGAAPNGGLGATVGNSGVAEGRHR